MHQVTTRHLIRRMNAEELQDLYNIIKSKVNDDIVEPEDLVNLSLIKKCYKEITGKEI